MPPTLSQGGRLSNNLYTMRDARRTAYNLSTTQVSRSQAHSPENETCATHAARHPRMLYSGSSPKFACGEQVEPPLRTRRNDETEMPHPLSKIRLQKSSRGTQPNWVDFAQRTPTPENETLRFGT